MRTPLAGLLLHVERARATQDPVEARAALEQIAQLSTRAARTSNQLLSLMRAQADGETHEADGPVDLAALAVEAVSRRVPDGLRAGVDLGYQGPADGAVVDGHAAALRDMLDNLIDNAMLYAGRGHSVTVSVGKVESGWMELAVEDDGPGVPPDKLEAVFDRFYSLRPKHEPFGMHSGLGLSISKQIIEAHGGRIWAENRLDPAGQVVGARFVVRLPVSPP